MSKLLWIELRRLIPPFALLYFFAFIPYHVFEAWGLLAMIPFLSILISSSVLKRSSWYLSLPFSRMKIIVLVLAQNFIVFLSTLVLTFLFLSNQIFALWLKEPMAVVLLGWIYFFVAFMAIARNLTGVAIRRPTLEIFATRFLVRVIASAFFVLFAWSIDLLVEPVFYLLCMSVVFCEVIKSNCKEFKLPILTQKFARGLSVGLGAFLFLGVLTFLIYDVNFRSARTAAWPLDALGRFPSFVSAERAMEIFVQSEAGHSPTMSRHMTYLRSVVTSDQWNKRTLNCRSTDCFTLSSEVSQVDNLSPEEASARFLMLMSRCEFSLDRRNRVVCVGHGLTKEHVKIWMALLEKQGTLKAWLESPDVKKQIFAIKSLPINIDEETKLKVELVGQSADSRLKALVAVYKMSSEAVRHEKLDCTNETDSDKKSCSSWIEFKNI